jgi:tetratricopeptide (TPR) repeat protein
VPTDPQERLRDAELSLAYAQAAGDSVLASALELRTAELVVKASEGLRRRVEDLLGEDPRIQHHADRMQTMLRARDLALRGRGSWPQGIDAAAFWDLLGGSPTLRPSEKERVAVSLPGLPPDIRMALYRDLEEEGKALAQLLGEEAATRLREALREGLIEDLADEAAACAAAERLGYPPLVDLALAVRLGIGLDAELMPEASRPDRWWKCDWPLWIRFGKYRGEHGWTAEAWHEYGVWFMLERQQYREAETAFRHAISLRSGWAWPWNGLGNLLQDHLGRFAEAEDAYRQAIARNPQDAGPWNNLGNLLWQRLGRFAEAEDAYRQAIARDPQDAAPWSGLAWMRFQQRMDMEAAEQEAREAVRLAPNTLDCSHTLACILARRGNWREAVVEARRFLGGEPAWLERIWEAVVVFVREAVGIPDAGEAAVRAGALIEILGEADLGERWRPLKIALQAVAEQSEATLRRVAPEFRTPATELLARIRPIGVGTPDPGPPGRRRTARRRSNGG